MQRKPKLFWIVALVWGAMVFSSHGAALLGSAQIQQLRSEICSNFFVPQPLPPLEAQTVRIFNPAPGVKAEGVTYTTQLGARVPAILYLPDPLPKSRIPAFIVVDGHGGDKYCWYSYYTGILFARAGAAVLTYDQAGEGERNINHQSGTRAHDHIQGGAVLARHLAGLMITDVMQADAYLHQRPEVDPRRVAAGGYSLGSFVLSLAGAVDPNLCACVLVGGGDLDGHGGYWDRSDKHMCQAFPYQSLDFLGDRAAVIFALQAARGPLMIYNGGGDTAVAIPSHGAKFFKDLRDRVARLHGGTNGVFDWGLASTNAGHRPYWLTKPVAQWLEAQLHFPNWTPAKIQAMPEIRIGDWAQKYGVAMDKLYATELREGGTPALDDHVPGYQRENLNVFSPAEWESVKMDYILETWVQAAESDTNGSTSGMAADGSVSRVAGKSH